MTAAPGPYARPDSPIIANLPALLRGFDRKYADPAWSQVPQNLVAPLARFDSERVARGQSPLTSRQTAAALKALATGEPASERPKKGLLSAALGDLAALVSSIPKLPAALVEEGRELTTLPDRLDDISSNPIQAIGDVANLPGVRLIPGSFVLGALGSEEGAGGQPVGLSRLTQHPLFTGLDVLPVAHAAARATPVARARAAQVATLNDEAVKTALSRDLPASYANVTRAKSPITTVLTSKLDDAGNIVPTRFGDATTRARESLLSTKPGQWVESAFLERKTPVLEGRISREIRDIMDPAKPVPTHLHGTPLGEVGRVVRRVPEEYTPMVQRVFGGDLEREAAFFRRIEEPRNPDGTPTSPELLVDLPPEQRALAALHRDITDDMARAQAAMDVTGEALWGGRPEVFTAKQAINLNKSHAKVQALRNITATHERIRPVLDTLRPYIGTRHVAARVLSLIDNGRWSEALRDIRALDRGTRYRIPVDWPAIEAAVQEMSAYGKRARGTQYNSRALARAERQYNKFQERYVPARFEPALQAEATRRLQDTTRARYATDPDLDVLLKYVEENIWSQTRLTPTEIRATQREVRAGARALRDAGLDPLYVHHVAPKRADAVAYPRLSDTPLTPAQGKIRAWDASPYVPELSVAMSDQALQLLSKIGSDTFIDTFARDMGVRLGDLEAQLLPRAEKKFARDPSKSLREHLNDLVLARHRPFTPGEFLPWRAKNLSSAMSLDTIMVPNAMADNIKRTFTPPLPSVTGVLDKPLSLFRTSVLPLSARWHVNAALGNTLVMAIDEPGALIQLPRVMAAYARQARAHRRAVEAGDLTVPRRPSILPEGASPSGANTIPEEAIRSWGRSKRRKASRGGWDSNLTPSSPLPDRLSATRQWAQGASMRRLYNQARDSRLVRGTTRLIDASYDFAQLLDDMTRASMFLSKEGRYLRKGMSADVAETIAANDIRRSMVAWDEMTPIERQVMRSIMPFYTFAAWALKYTMRYPWDHPLRAQVFSTLTRTELEDAQGGLGERFNDMFWLGDPRDLTSPTRAIATSGFNPFDDVPSMFTYQGFLGQLNPAITATLESLGVDVMRGGPVLYPEMVYDAESGRLVARGKGSLVGNLISGFVPQTEVLAAAAGWSEEFNNLVSRDPDAAGRMLASALGVPSVFRNIDVGSELIKAELARFEDQDRARREALRSGDLDSARKYPALRAYLDQIAVLRDKGALAEFQPAAQGVDPGILALLGGAVTQRG